jgi:CBS-domain-containing membrane protein
MARTVAEIMNPKLLYILEGDRLSMARTQILKFGVTAVPVLDEAHRPTGVVSLRDLARDDEHVTPSTPVLTVQSRASVEEGARLLAEYGVHHLVVIDAKGTAVGMVSAVDFVRALVGAPISHPPAFDGF